ncbi:hypothetical protein WN51_02053 [Melipona quadrifasciata]|uniref:Uncharacterized protein n=1 Tax=Melipona quadrifasciata TaxID=166423 RepID=A0A0N0U4M3_9HYME|nr:hypothetical protein WN51_02053 [Melipona quadrifasciata]
MTNRGSRTIQASAASTRTHLATTLSHKNLHFDEGAATPDAARSREPRCATAHASRAWRGSGNPVFRLRQAQNVARTEKKRCEENMRAKPAGNVTQNGWLG